MKRDGPPPTGELHPKGFIHGEATPPARLPRNSARHNPASRVPIVWQSRTAIPIATIIVQRVWRWARLGVKAGDGARVKLRSVRSGRGMFTTAEWCHQFMQALSAADDQHFETLIAERDKAAAQTKSAAKRGRPHKRTAAQRAKAVAIAKARLSARGI